MPSGQLAAEGPGWLLVSVLAFVEEARAGNAPPVAPSTSATAAAENVSHVRKAGDLGEGRGEGNVGARFRRETDYSAAMATKIDELVKAERTVRKLHAELSTQGKKLLPELREKLVEALAEGDTDDATATLVRVSALLGELPGPEPVDLLIDVLGGESPEARAVAGEELENIAFERFKEVALGIERALGRLPSDSPALTELPYLLAEVAEPGCVKLLGRFLAHADPNVVASAIEALAELGDPAGAPLLAPIERDGRQVEMDDDADGMLVTLGELAHEARELLLDVDAKQTGKP